MQGFWHLNKCCCIDKGFWSTGMNFNNTNTSNGYEVGVLPFIIWLTLYFLVWVDCFNESKGTLPQIDINLPELIFTAMENHTVFSSQRDLKVQTDITFFVYIRIWRIKRIKAITIKNTAFNSIGSRSINIQNF